MNYEEIDSLAYQAVFGEDKKKAQEKIKLLAEKRGIKIASLLFFYRTIAQKKITGLTVPAINLRGLTFNLACCLFETAQDLKAGAFILELARSERGYTKQSFAEYKTLILAAALKTNFPGPIFLQVDHLQINPSRYQQSLEEEKTEVKKLALEALKADFFNFDIDASSLSFEENVKVSGEIINFIQEKQEEKNLNFGAELEEIGGEKTKVEDLGHFIKKLQENLKKPQALTKIAVQTGTAHGGFVTETGELEKVQPDFELLKALGEKARSLGLAGVVQHGASTLSDKLFSRFPEAGTLEIHLATEIQNLIFDHPVFPKSLREKIRNFVLKNYAQEGSTEEQVFYKERKRVWGEFKKDFWEIPEEIKKPMLLSVKEKFAFWLKSLGVEETLELVEKCDG